MRIWDLAENVSKELYVDSEEIPFRSVAITRTAKKLVAGNSVGNCFLWEQQENEYVPMQIIYAHPEAYILKCQFSQDDQYLATCSSDRTCKVFKLEVVEQINPNDEEESKEHDVTTTEEFVEEEVLSGHSGWVWDCDFTSDNGFIITVCTDGKARIWRMGKNEIRKQLIGHTKGITCLAFCDAKKS